MRDKQRKSTTPGSEPPAPEAIELPERWSVQRKTELVLRVLRGVARGIAIAHLRPEGNAGHPEPQVSHQRTNPVRDSNPCCLAGRAEAEMAPCPRPPRRGVSYGR